MVSAKRIASFSVIIIIQAVSWFISLVHNICSSSCGLLLLTLIFFYRNSFGTIPVLYFGLKVKIYGTFADVSFRLLSGLQLCVLLEGKFWVFIYLLQGRLCHTITQMYYAQGMNFLSNSDSCSNQYVPDILW
jgi:hypothetical protein